MFFTNAWYLIPAFKVRDRDDRIKSAVIIMIITNLFLIYKF